MLQRSFVHLLWQTKIAPWAWPWKLASRNSTHLGWRGWKHCWSLLVFFNRKKKDKGGIKICVTSVVFYTCIHSKSNLDTLRSTQCRPAEFWNRWLKRSNTSIRKEKIWYLFILMLNRTSFFLRNPWLVLQRIPKLRLFARDFCPLATTKNHVPPTHVITLRKN